MDADELVTADVIAEHYGVSVGTVNGWVRQKRIPCVRPSRRIVRFRLSDVEQAVTQQRTPLAQSRETTDTAMATGEP